MAPNHRSVVVEITSHSGVPFELFVLPLMLPGEPRNMQPLLAVLVSHMPLSCWLNDVAPSTVAEVVSGEEVRAGTKRAQHEGSGRGR